MNYLYTNAKSQWQQGCKSNKSRVCTRVVSTGSEGIKQQKIITIWGKGVKGCGLMKSNVRLQSNYGSSGGEQMPGCPKFWY